MKRLYLLTAAALILLTGCQFETSTSRGISIEKSELARIDEDNQIVPAEDKTFKRGEDVHYILYNVGKFKEGEDGLHWLEMDLEVTDQDDNIILDAKEMLGENGHIKLEGGYAATPYGTFETTEDLEPGKYRIKLTIYDKVGNGRATVSSTIVIE
ncbi:MAG: hypothetical protein AMS23_09610 [Bacteroides sp. SM1_62]|nr:MAG: hypothetical protein AMS26_01680 [Bacteroides sp. SM23_62]KPL21233.1 MAG: hypothetical protein AMS23_09610 [Bacteroides sp. SM1_62]